MPFLAPPRGMILAIIASVFVAIAAAAPRSVTTRAGGANGDPTAGPTSTLAPRAGRENVLNASFSELPPVPLAVTLTRLTFPAGSRARGEGVAGPRLVIVETQAIVVTVARDDRPQLVQAALGTTPDSRGPSAVSLVDGGIPLRAGDGLVLVQAPIELRNDGDRPASVLVAAVTPLERGANGLLPVPVQGREVEPAIGTVSAAPTSRSGSMAIDVLPGGPFLTEEDVLVEPLAGGIVEALPSGPGELRLDRLRIAAGRETPLPVQPGPWLLLVESGTLGLAAESGAVFYRGAAAANPASVPGRAKTVAAGAEVILTAGGMGIIHPAAVVELRNRGRTTLVLLAFSIWPERSEDV